MIFYYYLANDTKGREIKLKIIRLLPLFYREKSEWRIVEEIDVLS